MHCHKERARQTRRVEYSRTYKRVEHAEDKLNKTGVTEPSLRASAGSQAYISQQSRAKTNIFPSSSASLLTAATDDDEGRRRGIRTANGSDGQSNAGIRIHHHRVGVLTAYSTTHITLVLELGLEEIH